MCFFCPISNAKNCGGSCGLCGTNCPGYVDEFAGMPGMTEKDYDNSEF